MSRRYSAKEIGQERFFKMPKIIIYGPKYAKLSLGSKMAYMILKDRQELSIKNGWTDEDGYVYLNYKEDKLAIILNATRKTVRKYKKELVDIGLIDDVRVGLNKANRIYVLKLEVTEEDLKIIKEVESSPNTNDKTVENTRKGKKYPTGRVKITHQEGENLPVKKGNNNPTKREDFTQQKGYELPTNDTHLNDTHLSDIYSVSQSIIGKANNEKQSDIQTEFENIQNYFKNRLGIEDIKSSYYTDEKLIDEIEFNILEMYFNDYTNIQGERKIQGIVRKALMKLTYWHIDTLINKYKNISESTKITNPKSYIQSMIYNIVFENSLKFTNDVNYEGVI